MTARLGGRARLRPAILPSSRADRSQDPVAGNVMNHH